MNCEEPPYVAERVKQALAQDPRVGELGLEVDVAEEEVVVSGEVTTAQRRESVREIVHKLVPDHEVRNEVHVVGFDARPEAESLVDDAEAGP